MKQPFPISSLRGLIGQQLEVGGRDCVVIDVLEDGPQFVFKVLGSSKIQADQWGDARRRTPESFTVPVYEADCRTPNPLIHRLLDCNLTK